MALIKKLIVLLFALGAVTAYANKPSKDTDKEYADTLIWKVGEKLRLVVRQIDNSCTVTFDGKEGINVPDHNGPDEVIFRIDPVLTKGEHVIIFKGANGKAPPHNLPNPYSFQIYLEDMGKEGWTELEHYVFTSGGNTAPEGDACKLTITITGV